MKNDKKEEHLCTTNGAHTLFVQQVQAVDKENDTALHWAAYKGNVELVSLFLALGLSCKASDNYGQTPLHLASMMGCYEATGPSFKFFFRDDLILDYVRITG